LEIEETNLSKDEKARALVNIQKRLEGIGAENVTIVEQKAQKITFNFQGTIKPKIFRKNISVSGKLEFFEVCNEREILYTYLRKTYENKVEDDNLVSETAQKIETISDVLGIEMGGHSFAPIFAIVPKESKEKVTKMLLQKPPFFISELRKRVKFLLGKNSNNDKYELFAVYVNSENKAPLDGSYVTEASVGYDQRGDHVINLQMDTDGGYIWERLTEEAYQNRGNIAVVIDDFVYVAPSVSTGKITGGKTQISGSFTEDEAMDLANAFRAGAIPKMKILQESILKTYK
jgi:preprotein translocase subunit SecD